MKRLTSAVVIMCVFIVAGVCTLISGGSTALAYSAHDINSNIPGGRNTVVGWERDLWNILNNCRPGKDFEGKRRCINISAYIGPTLFLMDGTYYKDGLHSDTTITVDAGTKEVPLRFKGILFYGASMVEPAAGADYGYYAQQVVRDDNYPNDRPSVTSCQNIVGGYASNINCPALTRSRFRVTNVWSDNPSVNVTSPGGDGYMELGRNNGNSRYQFTGDSFIKVRSNSPAGFTESKDINIWYTYRGARQYYDSFVNVPTQNNGCMEGSMIGYYQFDTCPNIVGVAQIKIKVRGPNIEGRAVVDNKAKKSAAGAASDKDGKGYSYTEYSGHRNQVNSPVDATMTNNRPDNELTWWFDAKNKGKGPTLESFDLMSYRKGWGNSDWDIEPYDGSNMARSNWFKLKIKDGETKQFGCYGWGATCAYKKGDVSNSSSGELMIISRADAAKHHYTYTVKSTDAGKTFCQRLRWSWLEDTWIENKSPYACAYVPYHYPNCNGGPGNNKCDNNPPKECDWYGTCPGDKNHQTEYAIKPSVSATASEVRLGEKVTFRYNVANRSQFTKSKPLTYATYAFILRGGQSISNQDMFASYPLTNKSNAFEHVNVCNTSGSHRSINGSSLRSGVPCKVSANTVPKNGGVLNRGESVSWSGEFALDNAYLKAQPGDKICSFVAVDKWSVINDVEAPSVAASNVKCVEIIKSPSLQLTGSDAKAKGSFEGVNYSTSNTITGAQNRGSYSQFANIANNTITNFGSSNYTTIFDKTNSKSQSCRLDFANTASTNLNVRSCSITETLGKYGFDSSTLSTPTEPSTGSAKNLPYYADGAHGSSADKVTDIDVHNIASSGTYSTKASNLEVHGSLRDNAHILIFANGNVTISNDINYEGGKTSFASIASIPSLTIVANGNITIGSGVRVINANLVSKTGKVSTCKEGSSNSQLGMTGACNNKLQINGGIVSKSTPTFLRTFGSGNLGTYYDQWGRIPNNQLGDTAMSASSEWINYTPNIWATPYATSHPFGNIFDFKVVDIQTLPVRL